MHELHLLRVLNSERLTPHPPALACTEPRRVRQPCPIKKAVPSTGMAALDASMAALAMIDASPYTVRIGIMGCASIARKNARAIIRSERCTLVAVASRELPKADAFCDELKLDRSVRRIQGYDALLADKGIDAVYIPLPTKLHKEWVLKAAAAGKHVLVEKPVGVDANEVQEMITACRTNGVAFMDGTMLVHHKRSKQIDRLFADTTWQPKRVTSAFTFAAPIDFLAGGNIRTNGMDPLGCLGDVGWYCIRFGLSAFGDKPAYVRARVWEATDGGVPTDMDCDVSFSRGDPESTVLSPRLLTFHCSFHHHLRQTVEATSSDGRIIRMDDFVIPRREEVCDYVIEDVPERPQLSHYDTVVRGVKTTVPVLDCAQEVAMWDAFAALVVQRNRTAYYDVAMLTAHRIMDALQESGAKKGAWVEVK